MIRHGGCQCGKVRFAVDGELGRASLCHCRMCQKAFGGPFGALVSAPIARVTWTRAQPTRFASSNKVRRGFCPDCGTPLTFEPGGDVIDLAIFTFDDPSDIVPTIQICLEARQPWIDQVDEIPGLPAAEKDKHSGWLSGIVSHQHPDREEA